MLAKKVGPATARKMKGNVPRLESGHTTSPTLLDILTILVLSPPSPLSPATSSSSLDIPHVGVETSMSGGGNVGNDGSILRLGRCVSYGPESGIIEEKMYFVVNTCPAIFLTPAIRPPGKIDPTVTCS